MAEPEGTKVQVPTDFKKIIVDMAKDILVSFPEQKNNMNENLHNLIFENNVDKLDYSLKYVFTFCKTVYPKRFFDILYQTVDVFNEDIEFLPGINFKLLWNENITDKTRETIWKYLQLVLFNIVSSISDGSTFGDTAKLFETINQDEFKSKLEETISQMQTLFGENNADAEDDQCESETNSEKSTKKGGKTSGINLEDLPNPADIQNHMNNMMNSNLGKLAKEIAEETANELNIDMENATSINDVFKNLMSNPSKLMGLVKNVGSKLDAKMKSGDVKESDLLAEASEMMKKMKDMPGMGDIQNMMSKMGLNPQGKGPGKVNVNAMQNSLDKKLKDAKNRERILRNLAEKKAAAAAAEEADKALMNVTDGPTETIVFSKGEHVERSTREQMISLDNTPQNPEKKKKKKKNNK